MLGLSLCITGVGGALLWIPAPVIAADAIPANKRPLGGLMGSGIGFESLFVSTVSGRLRDSMVMQLGSGIPSAVLHRRRGNGFCTAVGGHQQPSLLAVVARLFSPSACVAGFCLPRPTAALALCTHCSCLTLGLRTTVAGPQ